LQGSRVLDDRDRLTAKRDHVPVDEIEIAAVLFVDPFVGADALAPLIPGNDAILSLKVKDLVLGLRVGLKEVVDDEHDRVRPEGVRPEEVALYRPRPSPELRREGVADILDRLMFDVREGRLFEVVDLKKTADGKSLVVGRFAPAVQQGNVLLA